MLALWNILLNLLWPLLYLYPPFRGTLAERLGRFELGAYNPAAPLKVLINAVSAGEVVAIAPFIRELLLRQPEAQVALLTTTDSGQTMARDKLGGQLKLLAYFPLVDLPWVARRYLDRLQPSVYITTEAELWPNIQRQCRARGIPVALVNARLYLHNKRGLRGWIMRQLYALCDLIVCQDERQRDNFLRFGLPAKRLSVSGNTKFDFDLPEWDAARLAAERARLNLADARLLTAGSTHEGEDELLLTALQELRRRWPELRLALAPRHIERAGALRQLAAQAGWQVQCLSEFSPTSAWDVLLIDSYGVLTDFYRLADLVVLGGSFHPKVGGHNILEATALGRAVVCGPHTYGIVTQEQLLADVGGLVKVQDGAGLTDALAGLLADPARASVIGRKAQAATLANRGSSRRAVQSVLKLLKGHSAGI